MSSRAAVVMGLLGGILTAVVLLAAVFTFGPDLAPEPGAAAASPTPTPTPPGSAVASVGPPSARPTPAPPVPSATPTGTAGSPSPSSSPSPTPAPRSPVPGTFHVGERAPALKLPLLGGGTVSLASLKGKPVWLNFMGTYCPPCRDEFPVMSGFQARYASTGLVILAVDVREDTELIQSFVGETGATFAVALDRDGAAQKAWGAVALPTHYWIDASGVVRDGALGGIGPDQMAESLGRILPGVTVTP